IDHKKIPFISNTLEYAQMGLVPAGAYANRGYIGDNVIFTNQIAEAVEDMLFDPQTSGGLLISISKEKAELLLDELKNNPTDYAVIGEVVDKKEYYLIVE